MTYLNSRSISLHQLSFSVKYRRIIILILKVFRTTEVDDLPACKHEDRNCTTRKRPHNPLTQSVESLSLYYSSRLET